MLMVAFSQEANSHLERYLRQIRTALREQPSVDADEVERDVLGHIDTELSGQPEPIGAARLLHVLDRLGAPDQWLPVESHPAWRRPFEAFRSGPGDWRLAVLTFACFVAGPALFMGRLILWPLPPLLIVISFLLARVALALFDEHGEQIGPRRWLIYPPLVVWYGALVVALVGGPVLLISVFVSDDPVLRSRLLSWPGGPAWMRVLCLMGFLLGIWWMLLGLLLRRFPRGVPAAFRPFADWFERRHAMRVALLGVCAFVLSGAILALLTWS
jgi:hypothetical protein